MKKLLLKLFTLVFLISVFQACNESLIEEQNPEPELKSASSAKKSYIVLLEDTDLNLELSQLKGYERKQLAVKSVTNKILKRANVLDAEVGHIYGTAVKGFSVMIPPGQLKKLQDDPSVKLIEEDQVVTLGNPVIHPDKPGNGGGKPGGGGGGSTPAQDIPWGITRVNGAVNATGKTAWIIDSGVDQDHPDLNVDTGRSKSFLGGKESTNPDDQNGHGTHVAGTIAAINNTQGVVGVAAGATVVSVRVLDRRGSGSYSGVIAGVDYVAANGKSGDVANMSLGGPASKALDDAVVEASKNVKFALAAGNESESATNHSPARANGANIYTVSAMDSSDRWAYFSNYGNPPVDFCAPGYSIKSCYKDGGYATMSGTSMAAPHVAGILLLGNVSSGGKVIGDPDGNPDIIAVH